MTSHPSPARLALFSRGDLPLWSRWAVARHVRGCEDCAGTVHEFAAMQAELSRAARELPAELSGAEWQALASEMTANIRLGIAAGECVSVRPQFTARPRLAFALSGLAVLLILAGLQHPDAKTDSGAQGAAQTAQLAAQSGFMLETSADGIAVHSNGRMLAVPAPQGVEQNDVIRTVSTRGDMRSRYVTDGGVTITAVYADAE